MATQVKITFTALHGNVVPAERILLLEPGSPTAPIGRASKSISKGLFSAVDNAWFDSPVMSREHAQLTMNGDDKTITIQDIGSMHGTYLNNVELPRNVPSTLNNGDIVVFGAEVRRGPETFPACSFRIHFEFTETKTANTFAFPESSDIEDAEGEDYDFSEDEHIGRHQQSSEDDVSFESSSPKASKISDAIDLTRDDSPDAPMSNRIDLTSETPSERDLMDMLAGRANDIDHDADPVAIGIYAGNKPILVETEDEEGGFSSDTSEQSACASNDSDGSEDSDGCLEQELSDASEDEENESEDMVIDTYDIESVHEYSDADAEEATATNNIIRFAQATQDSHTILLSDIRTRTQFPESVADDEDDEDDSESDLGLSEAGEAGIRALFDDGLLENEAHSESENEPDSEPEHDSEGVDIPSLVAEIENSESATAPATAQASIPPLRLATEHSASYATQQVFTGDKLGISYPSIRQPSPSDAAMVKSAIPQQQNGYPTGVCEVGTFGKSTAQILGDKTGKSAFFEAREANKAKFNEEAKKPKLNFDGPPASSSPFKLPRHSAFGYSFTPATSVPAGSQNVRRVGFGFGSGFGSNSKFNSLPKPAFPTREPCTFLDKPDDVPIPARTPSPPLDMTSAYSFGVSKSSAAAVAPAQLNSRGIKIDDIIDTSATPQRPLKLKRKADEISDATDKELRIWAKSSSSSNPSKVATDIIPTEAEVAAEAVIALPVSSNAIVSEGRPTKRIKKLLENVGYAALGGVAVGAGLFTVLVATAPDFL